MGRPAKPVVCIVTPGSKEANNGNWRTAARWAGMLRDRCKVIVQSRWDGTAADLQRPLQPPGPQRRLHVDGPPPAQPSHPVTPDSDAIDRLQAISERLSPIFRADRIIARQACFRPVTQDGLPLIGKVPRSEGAYVASGHNVWGILNAPATGEALAELIVDGVARSTDLTPFDPGRLRPLDPALLRSE